MRGTSIDYDRILSDLMPRECEALSDLLSEFLPPLWERAYRKMSQVPTSIRRFSDHNYTLLFDHASQLVERGVIPKSRAVDDRIVAAFGRTRAAPPGRNGGCAQGLLGPFSGMFGGVAGKEQTMGHALGGGLSLNLFPLRRDLSSELSSDGRGFRSMERYCHKHPGLLCFTRPIYDTKSWWPCAVEHGVLRTDRTLWIRTFENSESGSWIPSIAGRRTATSERRVAEA